MSGMPIVFPEQSAEVLRHLADRVRALRLDLGWRQQTLADRSGVPLATLRRFERTGQVSLKGLLLIAHALGRLDELGRLFQAAPARSIDELAKLAETKRPKRGRR